jgi:glycosyltransferase involved in cell wall biosynthesis
MRIVYISTGKIPSDRANSIQVMKVCQAYARLGHAVTLLSPSIQAEEPAWDMLAGNYGLTTKFNIQFVKSHHEFKGFDFFWKTTRMAKHMGAELIHVRAVQPAVMGLMLKIPVILEMHQMPSGTFGPIWFRLFLLLSGRKRLVPITNSLSQALKMKFRSFLLEDQVVIGPSGVDLERFSNLPSPETARKQLNLHDGWTCMCTGHLYKGRGIELVMRLAGRMPDVNFIWVGGTQPEVESWRKKIQKAGLQNLTLTGFIPNIAIPFYQAAADALLIPYSRNFTNSGGEDISEVSSPLKLFEYMAAGRVIICSDLPVLREILNTSNAILCPPEDADAWETALRKVQADPEISCRLVKQACRDVEAYSWLERCRRILAGFMEGSR